MEEESNSSKITSASLTTASSRVLASSEVKQEEMEDRTLEYQRNLEKVLDEYTERYESLSWRKQKHLDKIFDRHIEDLAQFHGENGHWKVPSTERGLYDWLFYGLHPTYKVAYLNGQQCHHGLQLTRHRYEKMVEIGYTFEEIIRDTTSKEKESVKIKEEDRTLEYKRNLEKVLDECTERYETLPEKLRKMYDKMFDVQLRNLADFHRKYGTWDVPTRGKYACLYQCVSGIRRTFRCAYFDGLIHGKNRILPRHRYEKLLEIGFPFVEDKKVHEDDEDSISSDTMPALVSPIYKRNLDKVLNEDTERYECLPKSRKDIYDKQFDENLQKLVTFHDKYGCWDPFDRKLNQWLKAICRSYKYAYYNGQQRRIQLPRHRYEKLVAIGYPFEKIIQRTPSESEDT